MLSSSTVAGNAVLEGTLRTAVQTMSHLVLIDLAVLVQLETGDTIEGALCIPGQPGSANDRPPHPMQPTQHLQQAGLSTLRHDRQAGFDKRLTTYCTAASAAVIAQGWTQQKRL